jgi:type IV pilus assembly protein PilN
VIRINLLPVREIEAKVGRKQEALVGATAIALVLVVAFGFHAWQLRKLSRQEAELTEVQQELAKFSNEAKEVVELQRKIAELREKNKIIDDLNRKRTGPVQVMESLSGATPARLWLTEFKETGGSVTIIGLAIDNLTIAEFLKTLNRMPNFHAVELVETIQSEQESSALKKFTIKSHVSYHEIAPAAAGASPSNNP